MNASKLRARAREEADELGPEPADPRERWQWDEEWQGAVQLLAGLADYDPAALRQAALEIAEDLDNRIAHPEVVRAGQSRPRQPRAPR
ncbi:MAG TPA: hypothetical protein VG869_08965 [Acidimicrobiia bacterium]|jgi:hypothetical protein|nr:hypothetical protein [Acidimicrobiia bacterium]